MAPLPWDRKFMEIAANEMNLSKSEHKEKTDPLVGAVLVSNDGIELGRAHRAHVRRGDHAEYTLIERFLAKESLEGCTLYTTLEPCARRNPPKRPCAQRIINARIGRVVVGITDPDRTVYGNGIAALDEAGIELDFFDSDIRDVILDANKYYLEEKRRQSETVSQPPQDFQGASPKETEPIELAGFLDLSDEAIAAYAAAKMMNPNEINEHLMDGGYFFNYSREKGFQPTVAGLIAFGKNPAGFLYQCKVKAYAFRGRSDDSGLFEDRLRADGRIEISGPLAEIVRQIEAFFHKHAATVPQIRGMLREEVPEYPVEVIREAIVNALVHRDYREGAYTHFEMYQDKLIVRSPGHAPRPITLEQLKSYEAPSIRRNPRIANVAAALGLMEEDGRGLEKMRYRLTQYGLVEPEIEYSPGQFVLTLFGRELSPTPIGQLPESLTDRQRQIVAIVKLEGKITSAKAMKEFNISRETAAQDFKKLIELGILQRRGAGRAISYVLLKT